MILAYVDDVNALVPTRDVQLFLDLFEKYGKPLGAALNTEKTRILTSTSNTSTSTKLMNSGYEHIQQTGTSLSDAISKYSRHKDGSPAEITDGLRVLGSPVGSIPSAKHSLNPR